MSGLFIFHNSLNFLHWETDGEHKKDREQRAAALKGLISVITAPLNYCEIFYSKYKIKACPAYIFNPPILCAFYCDKLIEAQSEGPELAGCISEVTKLHSKSLTSNPIYLSLSFLVVFKYTKYHIP